MSVVLLDENRDTAIDIASIPIVQVDVANSTDVLRQWNLLVGGYLDLDVTLIERNVLSKLP